MKIKVTENFLAAVRTLLKYRKDLGINKSQRFYKKPSEHKKLKENERKKIIFAARKLQRLKAKKLKTVVV